MQPFLAIAALLIAFGGTALVASDATQVWVPGHWQAVGAEQIWVPGSYCARPVVAPVTTVTVVAPPPPPPQVWVAERWVWTGTAWQLQPGHWEVAGAPPPPVVSCPPTTVVAACPPPPPQVVEVHHYERPRPSFGVGVVIGGGGYYGHHHHHHGYREPVRHGHAHGIPAPLPGSHSLPRPPRHLPDPLGVFRHDPLHLLRR